MSVISLQFFALLALTVTVLAIVPAATRKYVLLAASGFFYVGASISSAAIVVAIIVVNYLILGAILNARRERSKDRLYRASIVLNLAAFCGLKLAFEPAPNVTATAWSLFGVPIGYPLGFSFLILMVHSAITDAYSEKYLPRRSFSTFALFATFFPYVTAGPVERLDAMEGRLAAPKAPTLDDVGAGIALIALGLLKKLVAANRMKTYVDVVFTGDLPNSAPTMALAIALNAAYIYCDFSGYTDIARGAARCLGIDIRINFNKPFASRSVTEFWRRWHISFSTWLRDYLYMPLAYSLRRRGANGAILALLITFIICGFWHRAAWTFLIFGLLHGLAMAIEMKFSQAPSPAASRIGPKGLMAAAHVYTLVFLALTIVLFSAKDLAQAGAIYRGLSSTMRPGPTELLGYRGPVMFLLMFLAIAFWQVFERWQQRLRPSGLPWFLLLAGLVIAFFAQTDGGGFIYAQF